MKTWCTNTVKYHTQETAGAGDVAQVVEAPSFNPNTSKIKNQNKKLPGNRH
jgi:hypothetical protein